MSCCTTHGKCSNLVSLSHDRFRSRQVVLSKILLSVLYCNVQGPVKACFFIYKSGCVWPQSVASARLVNQQKFSIFAKFYFLYCENVRKHEFCHYAKINMFGKCAKIYICPVSKPAWVVNHTENPSINTARSCWLYVWSTSALLRIAGTSIHVYNWHLKKGSKALYNKLYKFTILYIFFRVVLSSWIILFCKWKTHKKSQHMSFNNQECLFTFRTVGAGADVWL